jgi:hypothetical protein
MGIAINVPMRFAAALELGDRRLAQRTLSSSKADGGRLVLIRAAERYIATPVVR